MVIVLLQLRRKFDMHTFNVGKTQEQVVPCPMTTRTPQDRCLLATQVIGPCQQFRTGRYTIADMINIWFPSHENESMMIAIAAEPDAFAQQPVGDVETQGFCIKFNHSLQMRCADGQVLQRMWVQACATSLTTHRR